MYEESTIIDQIVISDNIMQIRQAIIFKKNGEEISRQYNRYCLTSSDNVSNQPEEIKKISTIVWP